MNKDLVEEMYLNKNTEYFSLEREIFKNSVIGKNLNILDIGCGTGILGKYFKENQNCKVYGVEINESAYQAAKINLDNVEKNVIYSIPKEWKEKESVICDPIYVNNVKKINFGRIFRSITLCK